MGTMKAVVKKNAGYGAELMEVKIPEVGPEQVLVKVKKTSICGTDYHIYRWDDWAQENIKPPLIMGHELAGEVIQVGERAHRVKPGDFVSAETHIACGKCYQCQTGKAHICQDMKIFGVHTDGVFAEYAVLDETNVWINDPNIPADFALIQEPLGNAVDTIRAGNVAGKNVLITGTGPVGLLAVGVARAFGATKIIVSEPNEYRREIAREMGADLVIDPLKEELVDMIDSLTAGAGIDFVAEMSGNHHALKQGLKVITRGGSMALLGLPAGEVGLNLSQDVIFKGITLVGITGREIFKTWHIASRLIKEKRINLEPVITHTIPLEEFVKGMELMKDGNCGKIVLVP